MIWFPVTEIINFSGEFNSILMSFNRFFGRKSCSRLPANHEKTSERETNRAANFEGPISRVHNAYHIRGWMGNDKTVSLIGRVFKLRLNMRDPAQV
jgi:hypothetical protein